MIFDTFAQKVAHLPWPKRAHFPDDKNIFLKSALESKKSPTKAKKCPKLPKRGGGQGTPTRVNVLRANK